MGIQELKNSLRNWNCLGPFRGYFEPEIVNFRIFGQIWLKMTLKKTQNQKVSKIQKRSSLCIPKCQLSAKNEQIRRKWRWVLFLRSKFSDPQIPGFPIHFAIFRKSVLTLLVDISAAWRSSWIPIIQIFEYVKTKENIFFDPGPPPYPLKTKGRKTSPENPISWAESYLIMPMTRDLIKILAFAELWKKLGFSYCFYRNIHSFFNFD